MRVLYALMLFLSLVVEAGAADKLVLPAGLTDFQQFKVYPYLMRAREALARGDSKSALENYRHAHDLVPDNVELTLITAQAWHEDGHDGKARQVLRHSLRSQPDNLRLQAALEKLPLHLPEVHTRDRLVRWQAGCEHSPDRRCLSSVAQKAIEIGALDIAWQVINQPELINGLPGRDLLTQLAQVAIMQSQWVLADNCFSSMDHRATLAPKQYEQWFDVLQHLQDDRRILDLQAQGVMNSPQMQLEYARSLAARDERVKLADYLESHFPYFTDARGERHWIQLIYQGSRHPVQLAKNYRAMLKKHNTANKKPPAHKADR